MKYRLIHALLAVALGFFSGSAAFANPSGPSVAHGQVSLAHPNTHTLNITNSPGAIINWQNFSIGNGQTTRFIQNSAASAILNRVTGQNPSALLGRLLSNGRVFLINRNGIVFGPNAIIDTAGLVASTLNITDKDFIEQNLKFQGDGQSGSIENQGYIKAGANGNIFLIAPNITNSGIIETDAGQLVLAAGESVSLLSLDSDHIVFDVQAPDNTVINLGSLLTHGGAARMFAGTIEHAGSINADSVSIDKNGLVQLFAKADIEITDAAAITADSSQGGEIKIQSDTGTVWNSGTIEARGDTGKGGHVEVLGERVALLDEASIDVSGETGGGEALIGGDYQGRNAEVKNAQQVYAGKEIFIKADAITAGDGGKVIVWSDETTQFHGGISAQGSGESGAGGLVETSGHILDVSGAQISASAAHGPAGQWLLDPIDVTIGITDLGGTLTGGIWMPSATGSSIANTTIEAALAGGTSVTITTTGGLSEAGNITVSAPLSATAPSTATLTLQADNNIDVNAGIGTAGTRFNHDLTLNAGNRIGVNSAIYLSDNLLTASAPTIALDAITDVGAGTVLLESTGSVTQSAAITAGLLELLGSGGTYALTHPGNMVTAVKMNTGSVVLTNNGTTQVNGVDVPGQGQESILSAAVPVAGEFLGTSVDVDGDVMVVGAPGTFITGQGAAYVYRWNGANWVFEEKLSVAGTRNFGRSVSVEGDRIVVGAPETNNGPSRSGAAYPFEWDGSNWVQGAQIPFTEKVFESEFGSAVAIDSNRLVVGGLGRTSEGGFWTGKIWFYELIGGLWVEQGNARQGDIQSNDYFGSSLDISGNKLIVGAPNGPADSTPSPGKAYIFEYNSGTKLWAQTEKLVQSEGATLDFFGQSVSISNDIAVVGAGQADPDGKADAGTLYVFRESGPNWAVEQVLKPADIAAGDRFGTASRVRDGTIVAASYLADLPGFVNAGAGYVFNYDGSSWLEESKVTATAPVASDTVGFSLDLLDQQIFMGALNADPGGQSGAGSVFTFQPAQGGSILDGDLTITSAGDLLVFASVTSLSGDIDLSSSNNITVVNDLLALGSAVKLQAGTDGSGDLIFDVEASLANPAANDGNIQVHAGSSASNTDPMLLSGENVIFQGASSSTSILDVLLRGTGTMTINASGDVSLLADQGAVSVQAMEGAQSVTAGGGLILSGGGFASGSAVLQAQTGQGIGALYVDVIGATGDAIVDTNGGLQDIDTSGKNTAGSNEGILVDATGAGVAAIHSDGTQDISVVNSDLVRVVATVGNADITSAGSQVLSVTGTGANAIEIGDIAGGLTSGYSLIGGNQTITAGTGAEMGSISLRAGTTGAADSRFTSSASQTISTTGNFTMTGGSGVFSDADLDAPSGLIDLDVGGNLVITGGSGSDSQAEIEAGSLDILVTGAMSLTGGSNTQTDAEINSALSTSVNAGSLTLTGSTVSSDVEITSGGNLLVTTGANLTLTGGSGDGAGAFLDSTGPLVLMVGGDLDLTSGSAPNTDANITSSDDSVMANVTGAVNFIGGLGLDSDVELESTSDDLTLVAGSSVTLSGGGGDGAFAEIIADGVLSLTIGGDLNMTGGAGANSDAAAESNSSAVLANIGGGVYMISGSGDDSDVEFEADTSFLLDVGTAVVLDASSGGMGAYAFIGMSNSDIVAMPASSVSITTGGNLIMRGGGQLDTSVDIQAGVTTLDIGGSLALYAGTGPSTSVEIDQASTINIDVGGILTMIGGSDTDSAALIGENTAGVTVTIGKNAPVGGAITLTGGSHVEGLAVIGSTCMTGPCPANVTINGDDDISLFSNAGEAFIGSLTQDTGIVAIKAGLSAAGFQGLFGDGRISTNGPVTLEAVDATNFINLSGSIDAGLGTLTATAHNDLNLPDLSAGTMVLTSLAEDVEITANSTVQALATGLAPQTPAISITAAGDVLLDLSDTAVDLSTVSGGLFIQGGSEVDLDDGDNDMVYNIAGDFSAISTAGDVFADSGAAVTARNVLIQALAGETSSGGNNISIDSSGQVDIATSGEIEMDTITASGDVTLTSSAGLIKLFDISAPNVSLEAQTFSDIGGPAINVTSGNLSVNTGNGFGSPADPIETQIGNFSVTGSGDVGVDNAGMALTVGTVGSGAMPMSAVEITADQITGGSIFATSADLSALAGSIALAVNAGTITLATTGAGASLSSNVGVALSQADIAGIGGDFSLSAPTLTLGSALNFFGGGATLVSNSGFLVDQNITSPTFLNIKAGSGTLNIVDSDITAGSDLLLSGGSVKMGGASTYQVDAGNELTVNTGGNFLFSGVDTSASENADLSAGTRITVKAAHAIIEGGDGSNTPATVSAPLVQFNLSGDLTVRGGASTFSAATVIAATQVDVNANNVFIQGSDDSSSAGIDPPVINMNLTGGLNIAAGSGQNADAFIIGNTVNINTQGDVTLTGGSNLINAGFAMIDSQTGNLTINTGAATLANPVPGNLTLTPGTGLNADAVLIANFGAGLVDITAGSCSNCNVLGVDPFPDPASQAGIFGSLNFSALELIASTDMLPSDVNEIIVLEDNLFSDWLVLDSEDDDSDEDKHSLMCR